MKKTVCFLLIFFIVFMCGISLCFSEKDRVKKNVFQYAFLYKKSDGNVGVVNHKQRVTDLKPGERIKIYLEPLTHAYIYLYHVSSGGDLTLLFPVRFDFFSEEYETGVAYYLPSEERWFILKEPPGIEEFHLIVSKDRLINLESLTNMYCELNRVKQYETQIADARQDILDEIKHLKKRGNILAGKNEKPVPIAGVVRAFDDERISGVEVHFTDVYATTIRIRH
jgi:hypothetical protein